MNPGLLKLAVVGSRSAYGRLAGIAGGVAVGVCLLLLLWGGANGLSARDDRGAWLRETGMSSVSVPVAAGDPSASGPATPVPLTADTVLMETNPVEVFRDQLINRRNFAALSTTTVQIPGIGNPPAPGQYYASPALQRLIESTPRDQLGDRFGQFAGTIDDAALPGPDSLIVITGATESELRQGGRASLVSGFTTNPYGGSAAAYSTVLLIGAIAVFFPVLLLISIVTGLGAAQRRERFATLRLIGASPQTVSRIAAVETAVPSLIGAIFGVVLATLLRPATAQIPVNGTRMFTADLATGWLAAAAVVGLVVTASALVAGYRTARAGIGVTRSVHEKTPTVWRIVPLLTGLVAMMMAVGITRIPQLRSPLLELPLLVGGFALILAGIVVIGPWLTRLTSRIGLRQARSAAAVIAASRIQRTPVATFRSVSGLVVAVFVVSVFAGASSIIQSTEAPPARPGLLQPTSLHATVGAGHTPAQVSEAMRQAKELPGVRNATIGYGAAALSEGNAGPKTYFRAADAPGLGFEEIPRTEIVAVDSSFLRLWTEQPLPLTPAPVDSLNGLVPVVVVVGTDGTPEAMDRARTLLNSSGVTAHPATSSLDNELQSPTRLVQGLAVLAYLGMFVAIAIAGMSLAVSTASAVLDRKRVLGLMRLMGMPVSVLRRIISREAAVPLLTVLLLSIGLGFFVAWLMVTGINDTYRMTWPAPDYFAALALSLLLALSAVIATFSLLRGHTALAATRFE
ncbi:cell division protein FtsX [Arthrobacter sp. V4I6]|uniref:ABC transporter permease n=1 Tax=unclassified Arthrobacter TaxID=235627 RepID=UPI0027865DF9|nr:MULTISPECIES: ABC transporter permease [unclassified Arthrobacter]MDQ0820775.1 cell division protein FtsX [Arthrobacter sp. V1I7]MDQ0855037.1 cell division protein FtsX [Arthrobacter sp. V4I6]